MTRVFRQFVDGPFGQIHMRCAVGGAGDKRPLLCLHMFPQSSRNFSAFLKVAGRDRTVIAPDFPGHGESDVPPSPITAAQYAEAIWSAVDQLEQFTGDEPFDVFGIHAGAKLSSEFTRQRPDRVHRLVLSSPAVFTPEETQKMQEAFSPIALDEDGSRFRRQWNMVVASRDAQMTLEMCTAAFSEMLRAGEAYEWGHEAVFAYNPQFAGVLKGIDQDVLVLNPNDELYQITPRALDHLKSAQLIDLPDWKHGYLEARPESVAALVLPWLDNGRVCADWRTCAPEMAT